MSKFSVLWSRFVAWVKSIGMPTKEELQEDVRIAKEVVEVAEKVVEKPGLGK